jgi:hypothetical protein
VPDQWSEPAVAADVARLAEEAARKRRTPPASQPNRRSHGAGSAAACCTAPGRAGALNPRGPGAPSFYTSSWLAAVGA